MPTTPQVIIALDATGNLQIEAPGPNGMRQKIPNLRLSDLPAEIQTALIEQQDRIRREAIDRTNKLAAQVADRFGQSFSHRTVGRAAHTKESLKAMLHRAGYTNAEIQEIEARGELADYGKAGAFFFSTKESEARRASVSIAKKGIDIGDY